MEPSNKISDYLESVCAQIRWKKAHGIITKELEDHIIDQRDAFISEGFDDEKALDQAIQEMGDPIMVGSELDRTHRPKPEWGLILLTSTLLILGFLIRMFLTYDSGIASSAIGNIVLTIFGIAVMALAYFLDYTIIGKYPRAIYFGLFAITIASMNIVPGIISIGPKWNGQYFYPKFLMLLFPTAFAGIIYNMRNKGYHGIILSGIYFIIPTLICLKIPSLSVLAIYSITCLVVLTFAIIRGWFNVKKLIGLLLIYIPAILTTLFTIIHLMNDYQLTRLKSAINPYLDPGGWGWMTINTRNIIANAKLIGHNQYGINTEGLLPSFDTDFLLTHLIDRLGWISFIAIVLILLAFIIRALKLVLNQKNVLGSLISISVITTFSIQVIIYILNNLGFQLIAPLTLPLISYGRIGTIINMFLIGIMLSVFRSSSLYSNRELTQLSKNKSFSFVDGKIIIDLNR